MFIPNFEIDGETSQERKNGETKDGATLTRGMWLQGRYEVMEALPGDPGDFMYIGFDHRDRRKVLLSRPDESGFRR